MPSPEPISPRLESPGQVVAVLGLVAASKLTAFEWLADDAAHTPQAELRVALARLAAGELDGYEDLAGAAREQGAELVGAAEPHLEILGGIGRRTLTADWWERLVRSVVAGGMVRDLVELVVEHLGAPTRELATATLPGRDLTELAAAQVAHVAGDEPLAARLALWGRRVAGEALGVVQPVLGAVDPGLGGLAGPAVATISAGHARRMERLGLAS